MFDILQIASVVLVGLALVLNGLQMRYVAQQATETRRQASAANAALGQAAYQSMQAGHVNYQSMGLSSPSMIAWYLRSRGYEVSDAESNQRTMWILVRLNTHESTFIAHTEGLLSDDIWFGWRNVIQTDFCIPEFLTLWPHAKKFFARSFVTFIDDEILRHVSELEAPRERPNATSQEAA